MVGREVGRTNKTVARKRDTRGEDYISYYLFNFGDVMSCFIHITVHGHSDEAFYIRFLLREKEKVQ